MPRGIRVSRGIRKGGLRVLGSAALLAALPLAANADTIATFDWVPFQNGGAGAGSGDFVLTLPGSVPGPGFDAHFASVAAAQSAVTGFSYTFSNGDSLSLSNLQASTLAINPTEWLTTDSITPAGTSTPALYLGTNFSFGGFVTPPGGSLTPFKLASSGGMVTLGAGDAQLHITDTGYWRLDSLTPVPLPAAGLLLISGLAGLFGVGRSAKLGRGALTPAQ
jgi:hypothetical protein